MNSESNIERKRKPWYEKDYIEPGAYLLHTDQIKKIVKLTVDEAFDAVHWDERMDIEVLWIRIKRILDEEDNV